MFHSDTDFVILFKTYKHDNNRFNASMSFFVSMADKALYLSRRGSEGFKDGRGLHSPFDARAQALRGLPFTCLPNMECERDDRFTSLTTNRLACVERVLPSAETYRCRTRHRLFFLVSFLLLCG